MCFYFCTTDLLQLGNKNISETVKQKDKKPYLVYTLFTILNKNLFLNTFINIPYPV